MTIDMPTNGHSKNMNGTPQKTTELIIKNYHSYTPSRVPPEDTRNLMALRKSFRRILLPLLPADKTIRILDAACGEGHLLDYLRSQEFTHLDGFDLSSENVALCQKRGLSFVKAHNALHIMSFCPGKSWDVILCMDLLEHLHKEDLAGFLTGVRSRLSDRGVVIIQTPNMGYLFAAYHRYNDLTHETGLTEHSAVTLLRASGFGNIEIYPSWAATTLPGFCRERCLSLAHRIAYLLEGKSAPRIPTKNLLIKAARR